MIVFGALLDTPRSLVCEKVSEMIDSSIQTGQLLDGVPGNIVTPFDDGKEPANSRM